MAYCTSADVNSYLGGGLTSDQLAQATALIPAVQMFINSRVNRSWDVAAVTDEHRLATGASSPGSYPWTAWWWGNEDIHLNQPFVSITSVVSKQGATSFALDYDVIDASTGWIRVRGTWYGRDVYVSYVPSTTVPADIKLAATMLTAYALRPAMHPEREGMSKIEIGDRELVQWMEAAVIAQPLVIDIFRNYKVPVFA